MYKKFVVNTLSMLIVVALVISDFDYANKTGGILNLSAQMWKLWLFNGIIFIENLNCTS